MSREMMMKLIYGREIRVQQLQMNEMGGGANRDRTGDLLNAIQALSQLSYSPTISWSMKRAVKRGDWIPCPTRKCQAISGKSQHSVVHISCQHCETLLDYSVPHGTLVSGNRSIKLNNPLACNLSRKELVNVFTVEFNTWLVVKRPGN